MLLQKYWENIVGLWPVVVIVLIENQNKTVNHATYGAMLFGILHEQFNVRIIDYGILNDKNRIVKLVFTSYNEYKENKFFITFMNHGLRFFKL